MSAEPSTPGCAVSAEVTKIAGVDVVLLRVWRDVGVNEVLFDGRECFAEAIQHDGVHAAFLRARDGLYERHRVLAPISASPLPPPAQRSN
jgi:hypothetical protein